MRTRIKFCGITRVEDALESARLGVDAIGLVFVARSARVLEPAAARAIALALPPFVARVALFADADAALVERVLREVPVELLQFHGREDAAFCTHFGRPYIKAIAMSEHADPALEIAGHPAAAGFLLDSPGGGSGVAFDWSAVPPALQRPLILAGGLTPANVADAVRRVRPAAVDVSSGIEASPGTKDHAKMRAFVAEVHRVDNEQSANGQRS